MFFHGLIHCHAYIHTHIRYTMYGKSGGRGVGSRQHLGIWIFGPGGFFGGGGFEIETRRSVG